ncbi:MAG: hypothetical protein ACK5V3_09245 [Bdellovibrionales bacterium]
MQSLSWFRKSDHSEVTITKFKSISDNKIVSSKTIKDQLYVFGLTKQITSLPVNGDKMKSWGDDAEFTKLVFSSCASEAETIEIYEDKIKTPSTGFLADKTEQETILVNDIESLLDPQLGRSVPKVKDLSITFKDFTILFAGSKHRPQPPGGPTVGPTTVNFYKVIEKESGRTLDIEIFEGQTPPQPYKFSLGDKKFILWTHKGPLKEHLWLKYFIITENSD